MSRSTGQPRICRTDAGTERIVLPFVNVRRDLPSSTTEPRNNSDREAKATQSANRRFAASSPALTTSTRTFREVAAACNAIFANDDDFPTCRPATTTRYRASDRANSA